MRVSASTVSTCVDRQRRASDDAGAKGNLHQDFDIDGPQILGRNRLQSQAACPCGKRDRVDCWLT